MRVDPLQVQRSLRAQFLRIQVDPEERASFIDQFLRESRHVAYRKAHGIEEGTLLDPPAEGLCKAFLALGIERARSTQFFNDLKNVQRVAVELCPHLKNWSSPIASRHRRELGARRPYRNLDR